MALDSRNLGVAANDDRWPRSRRGAPCGRPLNHPTTIPAATTPSTPSTIPITTSVT